MKEFHERISTKNGVTKKYKMLGPADATKVCTKCGVMKSVDDYHVAQMRNSDAARRIKGRCKQCSNIQRNVTRNIVPDWPKPDLCECCGKNPPKHCDHDHDTSKFRGWLCSECNTGFGKLGDNWQSAQNLYNYAKRHYEPT